MNVREQKRIVLSRGLMVDVETAGPGPSRYALLSLGACVVGAPSQGFYVEIRPDRREYVPSALAAINHSDLSHFDCCGIAPKVALIHFLNWVTSTRIQTPLFVAHNAAFDWMFYADYCVRYEVENPFGYKPFDTASAYGSMMTTPLPHHAGEDAYLQTLDLRHYYGLAPK